MKNLVFKAALLGSLFAVSAMAESGFIGIEAGYDQSKLDNDGTIDDNRVNIGIKFGQDLESHRIYMAHMFMTQRLQLPKQ